ncbi:CIA30 family protein [Deinococcus oregonensis]|uniref:CIA30 family protein n=1 Tax=Deinococcus oregonensis TaxID=1805970 RepID=A0ABV6AV92_9DEIO
MNLLPLIAALFWSTAWSGTLLEFKSSEPAWYARNDTVMGGVSNSRVRVDGGVLLFTGQVRLENNGGFSGIRSTPSRVDLSAFSRLILRVKGDGKRYALQLGTSTGNGVTYRNEFDTVPGQWIEVSVPLASLRPTRFGERVTGPALNPSDVVFFGLVIGNNRAERFALQVDWIKGQ